MMICLHTDHTIYPNPSILNSCFFTNEYCYIRSASGLYKYDTFSLEERILYNI